MPGADPIPLGGSGVEQSRHDAGVAYLDASLHALSAAVQRAKLKNPDTAPFVDGELRPVLDELSTAVSAYRQAYAAEREDRWRWARAAVSTVFQTAIRVGVPLAVDALTRR